MKYKRSMIMVMLAIFIFAMASASASDVNDTMVASEDTGQMELSAGDDIAVDTLKTSEENGILTQIGNDESVGVEPDSEILDEDIGNYSGLAEEIGRDGNIELEHKYYKYDSGSTIEITGDNRVIDGKGAVIDMAESPHIRAFMISAYGVTIKNMTIKNAECDDKGGAIYFSKSGNVANCNFVNNSATGGGGAVYFYSNGDVTNCYFNNNQVTGDYSFGGAVRMYSGSVENCYFINNQVTGYNSFGGAVYFDSDGDVTNCYFNNNQVTGDYSSGGAIYFSSGTVTNCNFTNNSAYYSGAVMMDSGTVSNCNFTGNSAIESGAIYMTEGSVENCYFANNSAKNCNGAVGMDSGSVENCYFTNNTASYIGGAISFNNRGNVTNCYFNNNQLTDEGSFGGAICMFDGSVENCNFTNNKATGKDSCGGAIYIYSGSVENCNFVNNLVTGEDSLGGAVYFDSNGDVTNCNFTNNTASRDGGAVYFWNQGTVSNCNFAGNNATGDGSAVYFNGTGEVTNCNFAGNNATGEWGGAVYFFNTGSVSNCNFTGNTATYYGGAIYFLDQGTVTNCNFTDNTANFGGSVFFNLKGNVTNCNFAGNNATGEGGAINMGFGTVSNCNFAGNNATGDGGAIYFLDQGTVTNCNFTDNTARYGGAIFFLDEGTVTNCNFTGNTASVDGGAIWMYSGSVENCNFTNNSASSRGGAVYFTGASNVTNCNFTNNTASGDGGAVYFNGTGNVTNCNFINNSATYEGGAVWIYSGTVSNCNFVDNKAAGDYSYGGAVYFSSTGTVSNCNFVDNKAAGDYSYGGAIFFLDTGNVTNCNFAGNTASRNGGAVYFWDPGTVTNCNFTDNEAYCGGAVYFLDTGTVTNCNFTNNTAGYWGGAVSFLDTGNVTNCNFTGNNATTGSAIYFYKYYSSDTLTVSNSTFLNNRANVEALDVVKNDNNITITFTGQNNLLNAIYSREDVEVAFYNVTYWGATGITTVSSTMSRSNKAAGQNISVGVVVKGKVVLNEVKVTKDNGMIVLPIIAGENYYISARHDTDSYYTEAEKTISNNTKFNVNVTSQTTNNKTVNITAKSNIYSEFMPGKLLFLLPNGDEINATYGANGTWWAVHTFDDYGEYKVNASYVGLDNVTVNNGTITINKVNSTIALDNIVLDYGESANVTVTTTGATGITAKIDGNDVAVINNYTIQISGLNAGNHTLTVTTISDNDHNPVTASSKITVNKVESTLTVDDIVFDCEGEGSCDVSFTGASEVNANVVNQPKAVVSVSGNKITVSGLAAGTYTLNVTTVPDENHTAVTETATITVNKVNSTLTLDDVELDYDDSKNVTVTTEGATGITAKIDGVNVTVSNYTIPISGLGAGNYTLTVTTIADKNHNPVTKEATITVNKLSTEIILANETLDLKVGDEVPVLANLTPAGAGNLTFTSSNEDLVFVEDNVTIVANSQGQAIITVSFAGNENYTAAENKTITVNVALNDASVSVENDILNLKVDETCAINATINPDTIMLHIKYTSSNESVATVDKNGIVTAVGEGRAIITLEVGDNEIYAKNSTTVTVTVSKINTTADVSIPENITVGDNSTVNVVLPADATGNVTVKVDGKVVDTVPVKDGNADVIIPSMTAGKHTVEIDYTGDGKYNPLNETQKISVSKKDVTPEITIPSDITFGDDATVDVKLPSDAKGNVTLNVDGKVIDTVPVVNGAASVKLSSLNVGNHTAEITYSGDDKYNSVSKTATISVGKDSTNLSAANVTATYKVNKYLVIKLTDSQGNPLTNSAVTVNLNGAKNYTTDENGQVKVKVSNLVPKTYPAKISFAGNDNYLGSEATTKVVVKMATPKITAKAKTFKTTTKTKKYTITLKDNTGKAIKNAKVTLKVNGKTYKATTNSKGKATFKITKLNKKGTFKATITYTANKYYKKVTKKVSIKVKSVWKTVQKGSKKKAIVKKIQRALKKHGYYLTYNGRYLKVDGIFWDYTKMAVKQFQNAKTLKVTGKVDEKTAKKLGII